MSRVAYTSPLRISPRDDVLALPKSVPDCFTRGGRVLWALKAGRPGLLQSWRKSFDRFGLQFSSFKMNINCSYKGLARLSQGGSVCGSAL